MSICFGYQFKKVMLEERCAFTPLSTRFFFLADSSPVRFLPFSSPGTGPDSLNFSRRAAFGFLNAWNTESVRTDLRFSLSLVSYHDMFSLVAIFCKVEIV